jgi:two-component system, NtrC family, sensor kinase
MGNIRVHLDLAQDLPLMSADPHQLQQVFLNMVNNAVDAILESSEDGDLWVCTRSDSGKVYVEFTDSGPGVQEASRVFDPFYTTKPVGKGTGLGLSICYGIVTEHGGTIRVRNLPHRGASFTIELPFRIASESPSEEQQPEVSQTQARVLCIDSDDAALKLLEQILNAHGHQVHIAKSGKEACAVLDKFEIDVIVADVDFEGPVSQGKLPDWLTGSAISQRLIRMHSLDAADVHTGADLPAGQVSLKKPLDPALLLNALHTILSARVHSVMR